MRIYRYVPDGRHHASLFRTHSMKWWPDGIDLGSAMSRRYPRHWPWPHIPWPHEGNDYDKEPERLALPDFPVLSLMVPVVSPRAARLLTDLGPTQTVPVVVGGEPFLAVQPLLTKVRPDLSRAFVAEASRALTLPAGRPFLYYARVFEPAKIPGEFFTIPEFEPYSDLYVTERLVDRAREAGLTGLDYLELVFDDDGPVIPRDPRVAPKAIPRSTYREELEREVLEGRCGWLPSDVLTKTACDAAVCDGYVAYEFIAPTYERLDDAGTLSP